MALVDSNTFIEPTAGTSLNAARSQFNNALRSLLTNFKSPAIPAGDNITASGAGIGEQDGMLYRSATTNALYISDSVHVKSSPVGGNFTRVGIGNRVENGIASLAANVATYEIGELTATVSAAGGLASNGRLYLITANNGTMADVVDVGIPPTNGSVTNTMIAVKGITIDRVDFAKAGHRLGAFDGKAEWESNTTLRVSALAGVNSAIGIGSLNSSNAAIVHRLDEALATAHTKAADGLHVMATPGVYANLAVGVLAQSSIANDLTSTQAPLLPAGSIIAWGGATAPSGWLLCDGDNIGRTAYAALFAAISTTYGVGDGSSTFNIPDLQNRIPYGADIVALGTATGTAIAAAGATTTSSETLTPATGTVELSSGAKDAGATSAINVVTIPDHSHTYNVPGLAINYIIKT
jgi:hypothetical protein